LLRSVGQFRFRVRYELLFMAFKEAPENEGSYKRQQ
jgi:hypothetical protein